MRELIRWVGKVLGRRRKTPVNTVSSRESEQQQQQHDVPQSPGKIKRREVSWTLTKKLDASAGPGEIKRREVVLDHQVSPEEIESREVELGLRVRLLSLQLFPNGGATDIDFVTLFRIAVGTAIAWSGSCCAMLGGHCLNILSFWRRSTAALVFRVGARLESSLFSPPLRPRRSVDVKQLYATLIS